jgi:hypothetical protein
MILENCHGRKRNLSTAWIDYRKAFDSVPHSWIIQALEIYRVSPVISEFLEHNMALWNTTLMLNHSGGVGKSQGIKINRGIFQGDSLSPLLFCLSLIPLSTELNNAKLGYRIQNNTINHLFYMDDLKLYAKNDSDLEGLLKTVKNFSDDIGMDFGLEKCAKVSLEKGRVALTSPIDLDISTTIRELEQDKTYKYLGVNEGGRIQHSQMKEKIKREYYRRVRLILNTELNSQNRFIAINSLATPVVQYSYNIINWTLQDIKRMDVKTRKLLTSHNMHHPKADIERLYLPRNEGGRGLISLEMSYKTTTIGLEAYLDATTDWMMTLVKNHENKKSKYSIIKEAKKFKNELSLEDIDINTEETSPTRAAKIIKGKAKEKGLEQAKQRWQDKPLHGQYLSRTNEADVDKVLTHQWLRSAGLKAETEGFIVAAQDQSLSTRNYQANIIGNGTDPKCRLCGIQVETIDHLVSGCSLMAANEYKNRHDQIGQYIHWKMCKHYGKETTKNWYEHHPQPVTEIGHITILWDFTIHTDRTIKANRPDITVKNHTDKTCLLIDMAVPTDKNVAVKEFNKIQKYKDLGIEIAKMWKLKPTTIPVIIGALGVIKKGTEKFIDMIPGKPCLKEIQKITLMGTAHILRRALTP